MSFFPHFYLFLLQYVNNRTGKMNIFLLLKNDLSQKSSLSMKEADFYFRSIWIYKKRQSSFCFNYFKMMFSARAFNIFGLNAINAWEYYRPNIYRSVWHQ